MPAAAARARSVAEPPVKQTQILEAFDSPDYTGIPPLMEAWANDQGKRLLLHCLHQDNIALMQPYGIQLIDLEDLPEEGGKEMLREAKDMGYVVRDGHLVMTDCALFMLPEDRALAMEEQARMQSYIQDVGSLGEAVAQLEGDRDDIADRLGKRNHRGYVQPAIPDKSTTRLSDHIGGGPLSIPPNILKPPVPKNAPGRSIGNGPVVRRRR